MNFRFQISLTENDYLEFNKFHMLKSPYGAKNIRNFRIAIIFLIGFFVLLSLILGHFTLDALINIIPLLILLVISQLLLKYFFVFIIKRNISRLKKKGKMPYSLSSRMEFGENSFVETTEENKIEQKYSSIERISIIKERYVYIHTNSVMAYILPMNSFESKEQYNEFLDYIKTKCTHIDFYETI